MIGLPEVYNTRCRKCKTNVRVDVQSGVAVTVHDKWRIPSVLGVTRRRECEYGLMGTRIVVKWVCPRCSTLHVMTMFYVDKIQQFPLDGLL